MNIEGHKAVLSIWKLGGLRPLELGRRIWLDLYEGDLFTRAAALSYYFLLALFPLLLFLMTMLGYFAEAGSELRANLLRYLGRIMPRSASQLIYVTIDEISKEADGGKLSFGLLAALWFASYGMGAISETLNSAYGVRESRSWWRVRLSALGLTVALAVLIISALTLVLYGGEIGEGIADRFGFGETFTFAWVILQWPIVLAFVLFAFALIYYFAPDLHHQKWYWITPGSIAGVTLWLLVSFCFRVYLRYFDRYSVTYGSLGAVIILMLWFYLTGAAILAGGKVNAEIENAAAKVGEPEAKLRGEKSP
ncbi:MAG TPA: YihY/virulence factor BrkB family protein [Blastocatellia bacterium]|jgi:membrane protein|nr:YihY/virulence factor BrkB family protein [Blastocatellia bacterium]